MTLTIGSFFSGYGGLDMGITSVFPDARTAWWSEIEPAACRTLTHNWPDTPNLGDITKIDWADVEPVDIICGGSPCQDVSTAGARAGLGEDTRSGLWSLMRDAIATLRPSLVVWENVRGALSTPADRRLEHRTGEMGDTPGVPVLRAAGRVCGDLASIGYDARWATIPAADAGAPHKRDRIFLAAWPAPAHTGSYPRHQEWETTRESQAERHGRLPTPSGHHRTDGPVRIGRTGQNDPDTWWRIFQDNPTHGLGVYNTAIARWEDTLGRPAPYPVQPNRLGNMRLAPRFVEWMMGLPDGHVTHPDIGTTRPEQLKLLGNGVCPQQCARALRSILDM